MRQYLLGGIIILSRRVVANLISIAMAIYFLVTRFEFYDRSLSFVIFTVPYIISNTAVLIMLVLSTFNKPKEVNDSGKMFLVSVLGGNLSIIVGLLGVSIMGTNINHDISIKASILSVSLIPFYLMAVLTLGRSLTVLPEANKLKTNGVYKVTRHPLYFTYIIWYILQVFICQSWIIVLTTAGQITLQLIRAKNEEAILENNFPEYKEYKSKVGWFFKIGAQSTIKG